MWHFRGHSISWHGFHVSCPSHLPMRSCLVSRLTFRKHGNVFIDGARPLFSLPPGERFFLPFEIQRTSAQFAQQFVAICLLLRPRFSDSKLEQSRHLWPIVCSRPAHAGSHESRFRESRRPVKSATTHGGAKGSGPDAGAARGLSFWISSIFSELYARLA